MSTVNISALATSQAIGYSDAAISRDAAGALALGNFVFNVDQTVGAGQDNYVLTFDNATGEIGLEAAAGGDLVNDTTPQLGGDLDCNTFRVTNVPTGSAASPSIRCAGSTNNGIYWASTTDLSISVAAAERFRFSSTYVFIASGGLSFGGTVGVPNGGFTAAASGVVTVTTVGGGSSGAAFEFIEQTAPSAPSADRVRLYAEDNGSGKTRLMALFPSGAAQQIAIEP